MSSETAILTAAEQAKRNDLMNRKPHVARKLARIAEMEARGEISPIIRLEKSYLCNFQCTHCSAEYYMDRHLNNVLKVVDERPKIQIEDIRRISREADELGLARFVITGGEPLVMQDFDEVVAAIDPEKHYIITDTNGWFLDHKRAEHIKSIGVEKVQLSLDSFIEKDHDAFRNKPGSYRNVMRAIDAALDAGLNLILSTVLVKGRAKTEEFRQICEFAKQKGIGLYVSYAKPTGSCTHHPEFVIEKEDADILRELEKEYSVFTHMTPSYGSYKGCITVKGIITITSAFEVTPCPYIDFSIGNLRENSLKEILDRGMRNPWLGPYRPDCLIGEDPAFIKLHTEKTHDAKFLPLPWGEGFSDEDSLVPTEAPGDAPEGALFDGYGRCVPLQDGPESPRVIRNYFQCHHPNQDLAAIYARTRDSLGEAGLPSLEAFQGRVQALVADLQAEARYRNLFLGPWTPFLLPKSDVQDLGQALQARYLPAVRKAFTSTFPEFDFAQHYQADLAGRLSVVPGTRHEALLSALREGPVVGCFLPNLTQYSLPAARRQVAQLPERFLLGGGLDACAALIAAPDLLLNKTAYSPVLWLAALQDEKPDFGCHFEAYGYNLTFNRKAHFGKSAESWASALVVLG